MIARRTITLAMLLGLACATTLFAQPVVIQEAPSDYQLFPRDDQDSSLVRVVGQVNLQNRQIAQLAIVQGGELWRTYTQDLVYNNGSAGFEFAVKIPAERVNHRFILQIDGYEVMSRHSVVSGDVFIINGQSNAFAGLPTNYGGEWVRSFGTIRPLNYRCFIDTTWGIAISGPGDLHAFVGSWGLVVGQRMSEFLDMPVAIINGAVGGTRIEQHQRDDNLPWNLDTIYGRLLYRMGKAGVREHVRSIFWHQGESDTWPPDPESYKARWDALYQDWHEDYPALEQIYFFQLRPSLMGDEQEDLREIQRQLPFSYDNLHIMTTAGIDGYDGLHYAVEGYEAIGELIWPLAARDLYGHQLGPHETPPDLVAARYVTPNRDRIAVQFTQAVNWPADSLGQAMRKYFFLDEGWGMVNWGTVYEEDDHVIILDLDGPQMATKLSYTPEQSNHNGGIYYGPWVRNPNGIAALLFHDVPIEPAIEISATIESPMPLQLGQDAEFTVSVTNHTQYWGERQLWSYVILPNQTQVMLIEPYTADIMSNTTFSQTVIHRVPDNFPAGEYEYTVSCGFYGQATLSTQTLYLTVQP